MLIMKNVSTTFNPGTVNEKCALKNLNLELKNGDFATIIGSNGAGKSTLFNAITGAFFIDRGLIVLDGEVGVVATDETESLYQADYVVTIGARSDEDAIARHLYKILREFDDWNVDAIYSESFSTPRIGQAIMNRLMKAAGHQVIHV